MHQLAKPFLALLLLGTSISPTFAATLESLLAGDEAPPGVVIEIVSGDETYLKQALSEVKAASEALRQRFPDLPIVVVSHGQEQFALVRDQERQYPAIHALTRELAGDDVPLHVCGTHASWYDIPPEAYPEYVDVAPSGPAQINDYRALGYVLLDF